MFILAFFIIYQPFTLYKNSNIRMSRHVYAHKYVNGLFVEIIPLYLYAQDRRQYHRFIAVKNFSLPHTELNLRLDVSVCV